MRPQTGLAVCDDRIWLDVRIFRHAEFAEHMGAAHAIVGEESRRLVVHVDVGHGWCSAPLPIVKIKR